MAIYVIRKKFVDAWFWSGANFHKIKNRGFNNMDVKVVGTSLVVTRMNGESYFVPLGHYFVKLGTGLYTVMNEEDFNETYEKVR